MNPDGTDFTWPEPAVAGMPRSVFAADLEIDGNVVSRGPVDLYGRVVGSVSAPEVLVAATGELDGEALTIALTVIGKVQGHIAAQSVTLASTSVVSAEVVHHQITIEPGAQFEGRLARRV